MSTVLWGGENVFELEVGATQHYACAKRHLNVHFKMITFMLVKNVSSI